MLTAEDSKILSSLMANPSMEVDVAWATGLLSKHPTFAFAAALLLARNPQSVSTAERKDLQAAMTLNSSDHAAFADLSDLSGDKWAAFVEHPEKKKQKNTADTIDTFLGAFSTSSPEEDALLERLIFNPTTEYPLEEGTPQPEAASQPEPLPQPEPKAEEKPLPLPPATPPPFVAPMPIAKKAEETTQKTKESTLMMESLAKIFIKQHRYERAFVIINNLILKYPEKSVYFADQLRFLQKLIINSKYKTK